jgi:hypothetical protein
MAGGGWGTSVGVFFSGYVVGGRGGLSWGEWRGLRSLLLTACAPPLWK